MLKYVKQLKLLYVIAKTGLNIHRYQIFLHEETLTFGSCNFLIWRIPEDLQACQYQFRGLDKWAPCLDSLEPLGLSCCVVIVIWCDVVRCGVVGLLKACVFHNKNAFLFNYYLVCHIQLVTCISVCHAGVYIEVMQWSEQAIRQKQRWLKSNMHTDNDTRSHIHTHTRTCSHALTLTHTHTHTHTLALMHSHSLTHTHTHPHACSHALTLAKKRAKLF